MYHYTVCVWCECSSRNWMAQLPHPFFFCLSVSIALCFSFFPMKWYLGRKGWVTLFCQGCTVRSIHRCYPATGQYKGFGLLRFRPGPLHPSLDNLVVQSSPRNTISIEDLAWTPVQHSPLQCRAPQLTWTTNLKLPVTWIIGACHRARQRSPGRNWMA